VRIRSRAIVGVTGLTLALALSGCGLTQLRQASDERILDAVSLTAKDAAAGATFEPYEDGDVVAGQDSLDLCDASYPSERLRIGRHQVGITGVDRSAHVSSEAILYSSPTEAQQAMGELEAARRSCPSRPRQSPDQPGVRLTWEFGPAPDTGWTQHQGVSRQAYAFTVSLADSDASTESTAVYLQRGRMILALYSTPPAGPEQVIVNSPDPQRFTDVMTQRLLAVPEEALEQGDPDKRVDDPRDIGT
jgi:hypothetical protein